MHDHAAHSAEGIGSGRMATATGLTLLFVAGEAFAGWRAHSLALMSDAGHNFADAAALAFSWYAIVVARRAATTTMSFGYHRVGVLAALANAASLVVIGLLIFWEAFRRFQHPEPVDAAVMVGVASVAVVLNAAISWSLHGGKHDLNIRSAYMHMLGDALSAGGVVVAGVAAWRTGSQLMDPLVSLVIGALILWSSWSILQESVNVLLEGVPGDIDLPAVETALRRLPNVRDVHHLHAWTISSGFLACSCHIVPDVASMEGGDQLLKEAERLLASRFNFRHTTIQLETTPCAPEQHCMSDEPTSARS